MTTSQYVLWLQDVRMKDIPAVGGKNASLGEMIGHLSEVGVRVPGGFATTAQAFRDFISYAHIEEEIHSVLEAVDVNDVTALAQAGARIREAVLNSPLPPKLESEVCSHYEELCRESARFTRDSTAISREELPPVSCAVRSSATAEDLPDASFAGQQETFLNISGVENIISAVKHVFSSLYSDRAISYRARYGFGHKKGFEHKDVAISVGVQRMVRSDLGSSGVMFTLDTESGFDQVVLITSAYGLGETVVQGSVNPDEFYIYKPALSSRRPAILKRQLGTKLIRGVLSASKEVGKSVRNEDVPVHLQRQFSISDEEASLLASYALIIEQHYGRAMDIEWGKDGTDGQLYILQARPETVQTRQAGTEKIKRYLLKERSEVLITGRAIGQKIGSGPVRLVKSPHEMSRVKDGDVLVTDMTDPDWEPVMKKAAAIITNRGGRTCHAAIIARELGIPAIVGCGTATDVLSENEPVTASCAEGEEGKVYGGCLEVEIVEVDLGNLPPAPIKISMNVGNPELAFEFSRIPNEGIGLARIEFIITRMIGVHPRTALDYPRLPQELKCQVEAASAGYRAPRDFYVQKLTEGISTLGAAFWPKPVIVRLSDFKSNEYASLLGGSQYEPREENPMIGFRGASRYVSPSFQDCFQLECEALTFVRQEMGLTNIQVMVPFVRTLSEAAQVVSLLERFGLRRGENGLKLIMMCEIPSNAVLAEEFLELFDGFSIGSNDMTQLTLGLDRDSGIVAQSFDERDPAVKAMLHMAIQACRKAGKYIGICGQGPSDHPDFAVWLMNEGIEAVSLNPDTVIDTWLYLARSSRGTELRNFRT